MNNNESSSKSKRKASFPKMKRQPTLLKFSKKQFRSRKSMGHAIRDVISDMTDYLSPILRLIFPNFIAVHYAYIIFMTLLCSLMMLPITKASDGEYIDTLLLAASTASQGGLNTVNLNTLTIWQQCCIFIFCFLTTPIFIHSALAFVRLYWFERYFDGIRDWSKRNFKTRRTRTLIHQNLTGFASNKPTLSKMLTSTFNANKSDRVLSQFISPETRTKSRNSIAGNKRLNTTRLANIDFAKPPKKTEIKFGGPDINIKERNTNRLKGNNNRVKSGFKFKNKDRFSKTFSIDPTQKSNMSDHEDEDFQSRLFRGEVVGREDENVSSDNDDYDERNDVSIDEDVNNLSYFDQSHADSRTNGKLSNTSNENKKEIQDMSTPVTKNTDMANNDDQHHPHFDIPEKTKTKPSSKKRSFSTKSGSWRPKFFSKNSSRTMDFNNTIEFNNRSKSNNGDEISADKRVFIPEDITTGELENLIHDPNFQQEVYNNWKNHNKEGLQRRFSTIPFPRLNTASTIKQHLKQSKTRESAVSMSDLPARTMSEHNATPLPELKTTHWGPNLNIESNTAETQEIWHDDGMDWENGKVAGNDHKSYNSNDEAIESYDDETKDSTVTNPSQPSLRSDDFDYEDEENENYDDSDYVEEEEEEEDSDEDDYGDDYGEGDIDFDYEYVDNDVDALNFEVIPTSNFVIGRNSKFVGLTDDQKEELGGVEYRALKLLCKYLVSYYIGFNILAAILFLAWISPPKHKSLESYSGNNAAMKIGQDSLKDYKIGKTWWAFFTASSSFNDLGLTLTPNSMSSFNNSSYILIWSMFFIIIGNTGFPVFLRFVIWVSYKISPQLSQRKESFQFLLEHPRRCFTLLFPRGATWWLFLILIALNGFDWIMYIILDYDQSYLKQSLGNGWFRALNGLYQSVCTRTAGFSTTNISLLSPAVQVSYMLMMYVSVMPLAISIRRTNVYEEQSLGIYHDSSKKINKNAEKTHTERSVRTRTNSLDSPLIDNKEGNLNDAELEEHASSFIGMHLRRQLSFDLWFLFLGLFIICICESERIKDLNDPNFTIWTILFEIVSAYGTVGLSLGYPNTDTSFCAQFTRLSKFIVVLLLLRGKHRGLPNSLDRAIMLPSDHLQKLDKQQFKVLGDDYKSGHENEEEENEEEERSIEEHEGEDEGSYLLDDEMDLGADHRLNSLSSQHQPQTKRRKSKDPLIYYINKRKEKAKNFVNETTHAVLHPNIETHHHNRSDTKDNDNM